MGQKSSQQVKVSTKEESSLKNLEMIQRQFYPENPLDKMGPRGTLYKSGIRQRSAGCFSSGANDANEQVLLQIKKYQQSDELPMYAVVASGGGWKEETIVFTSHQCDKVSDVLDAMAGHIEKFGSANISRLYDGLRCLD